MEADVIVVGSGASATSVAFPLVEGGLRVLMLDVGHRDTHYAPLIPDLPFSEIRRTDPDQYRYFLGDSFEGMPFGEVRVGAQLTPPRCFIQRGTERLTPIRTETFSKFVSLGMGGLAAGWGGVAIQFDDQDLADFPIQLRDLAPHYERVSARVGISGARDDLLPYYGNNSSLQPPLELDSNGELILARYRRVREKLNRKGIYIGRARLAALSRDLGGRRAQQYHDMDFYCDKERSVFRPAFAVEEMQAYPNFEYASSRLVESFRELRGGQEVEVTTLNTDTRGPQSYTGRRLALAAGALGTASIVLRSLGRYDTPVPVVSNPYTYVPCVNLGMLGKAARDRRHSLTQVGIVYVPSGNRRKLVHAQIYSYRSLLLFKLAKESFLAVPESVRMLRELLDSFVIVGIHHEDRPSPERHATLRRRRPEESDVLEIEYEPDRQKARQRRKRESELLWALRKLHCWPIKRIDPGNGASIHYAGTVPMSLQERELTVTPQCLLRGTRTVYLADGSVFPYLPAKALTLSLMANADRIGLEILREMRG